MSWKAHKGTVFQKHGKIFSPQLFKFASDESVHFRCAGKSCYVYQLLFSLACAVLVSVSELLLWSSRSCSPCQTGCMVLLWVMMTSIQADSVRNFTNPLGISMLTQRVVNSKPCNLVSKVEEGVALVAPVLCIQVIGTPGTHNESKIWLVCL